MGLGWRLKWRKIYLDKGKRGINNVTELIFV